MEKILFPFFAIALLFAVSTMACSRSAITSTPSVTPIAPILPATQPVQASTPSSTFSSTPQVDTKATDRVLASIRDQVERLPIATIVIDSQTVLVNYNSLNLMVPGSPPLTVYELDLNDKATAALMLIGLFDDKSIDSVAMDFNLDSKLPSLLLGPVAVESLQQEGVRWIVFSDPERKSSYLFEKSYNATKIPNKESIDKILEGVDFAALFDKARHIFLQLPAG